MRSLSDAQASGELGVDEELEVEEGAESSRSSLRLDSLAGAGCSRTLPFFGTLYEVRERLPTIIRDAVRAGGPLAFAGSLVCV